MLFYIIEKNETMRKAWEFFLKEQKVDCYTCDEVGDFKFIAEDLKPTIFICDSETVVQEFEHFSNTVTTSEILKIVPIVTVGEASNQFEHLNLKKHFYKPVNLRSIFPQILSYAKEY